MRRLNRFGRRTVRPVVAALAVLSVMGAGLAAGAQAADINSYTQVNGGMKATPVSDDGLATPTGTTTPASTPSPSATPQSPAAATQPTTTTATPTTLATPNPLTTRQATTPAPDGAQASGPQARTGGSHTVTFTSQSDTQGMPVSQTIPDRKTATRPYNDPTRPGWTFNGWFQGEVAYDFTKPVTQDLTLTAKWGRWSASPNNGTWRGGTDVRVDTPTSQVRMSQMATSSVTSAAVGSDGKLYQWGAFSEDITLFMRPTPDDVKFIQVATSGYHSLALDQNGRIWSWGQTRYLSLGREASGAEDRTPALVPTPPNVKFTQVCTSNLLSLALDQDGKVWTWGGDWHNLRARKEERRIAGRPVNGTPGPAETIPEGTVFTKLISAEHRILALTEDGTLWSWGGDADALGHPTADDADGSLVEKITVAPVETNQKFIDASSGVDHTVAIAKDGTVWTWGKNDRGQLGRTPDANNPADRPGRVPGFSGALSVAAGDKCTFVITDTGGWSWGDNTRGMLGINTPDDTVTPTRIVLPEGVSDGFRYIAVSCWSTGNYAIYLGSDGNMYGSGDNFYLQMGNNKDETDVPRELSHKYVRPVMVWQYVDRDMTAVLFGNSHNIGTPFRKADGWHVISPRHRLGTVTLTVQSTFDGESLPDGIGAQFTYTGDTATVTFETGRGTSTTKQQVAIGDMADRPDNPTSDDGRTFNGWFQGEVAYDFSKPVTGDMTLTARWGRWKADPSQGPWQGSTKVRIDQPTSPVRFAHVTSGRFCSLAVGSDGNVYTWGYNQYNQLGDNTQKNRSIPTAVTVPDGVLFTQVSAGTYHSMALDRDGNIWTWGYDSTGQLGRPSGDTTPYGMPGRIAAPEGVKFIAISAGWQHSAALDRDGNIWTWGDNQQNQLGRKTKGTTDATPAKVQTSKPTAFSAVSASLSHSMGLSAGGVVWTWGSGEKTSSISDDTVLGHGDGNAPAPVATGLRFTAISAGYYHSLAIAQDGTVLSWGSNTSGQLGRAPTDAEPAGRPGAVPGLTGATGVSAGYGYSIASAGGGVWAWGDNQYGQLGTVTGNGSGAGVSAPARIPAPEGAPSGFAYTGVSASASGSHTLAVGSDGDAYGFGLNADGQLGDNTTNPSSSGAAAANRPTMVWRPLGAPLTSVLFGAKPSATEVRRQADGWYAVSPRHRPETVPLTVRSADGTGSAQTKEDTGLQFTYTGDTVTLTFASAHGTTPDPQRVMPGESTMRPADPSENGWTFDGWFDGDVAYDFAAPLERDLTVTARWHRTGRWVLSPDHGSEYGGETLTLTAPTEPGIRLASVDTGGSSALGIGSDGNLYAWGDNQYGQLGDGTQTQHTTPVLIPQPDDTGDGFTWVQAASGPTHSAAIGSDGNLYTWGSLDTGLGTADRSTSSDRPLLVPRPAGTRDGFTWVQTVVGDGFTLALGSDDNLYAWGSLPGGLGDADHTTSSDRPLKVALPKGVPATFRYEQIFAGDQHVLAIGSDGNLYTWGSNTHGQLGHDDAGTPVAVAAPDPQQPAGYVQASAGGDHTLAIDRQGRLWAWGTLADGTDTATPVRIQPAGTADTYRFTHTSTGRAHYTATGQDHRTWTWGDNTQGQLGHRTGTPGTPTAIPGLLTTATAAGGDTTIAIDTNGDTQTWGDNTSAQGGHGDTSGTDTPRAAIFPPQPTPTGLTIGTTRSTLRQTGPGTWKTTTTAHNPGPVPVRVQWTLAGQKQPDDTTNTYTYQHTATLPNAGGAGIILLIIAGMLTLTATNANQRRRTTASHE